MLRQLVFRIHFMLTVICLFCIVDSVCAQKLPIHVIEAYEQDNWVYIGANTFLYADRYNTTGNPEVLSLNINPGDSYAMLYLYRYDCENHRVMRIAYKKYQNKPIIEKDDYIFEDKLEWVYPLKTTLYDIMLTSVCSVFGD